MWFLFNEQWLCGQLTKKGEETVSFTGGDQQGKLSKKRNPVREVTEIY
jgi:hypothetical protein